MCIYIVASHYGNYVHILHTLYFVIFIILLFSGYTLPVVAKSLMSVNKGGLSTNVSNATVNYYMSTVFDQVCTVCTYTRTPMVTPGEGRAERLSTHFDSLISEKCSNCVVIDFICPLSICFVLLVLPLS